MATLRTKTVFILDDTKDGAIEIEGCVVDMVKNVAAHISYQCQHRIAMVKYLRARYSLGLKDAKDLVDELYASSMQPGLPHSEPGAPYFRGE